MSIYFPISNTPRWVIFFIDISIVVFSVLLAFLLRFDFSIPGTTMDLLRANIAIIASIRAVTFLLTRSYAGIIRYTSTKDAQRIFILLTTGSVLFVLLNAVSYYFLDGKFIIPFSIIIIEYMASVFLMITFRIMVKILYFESTNPNREKRRVIIFGAGEGGIITKRTIDRDPKSKYRVMAFLDDDPAKAGRKLEGVSIYNTSRLPALLERYDVAHLINSVQRLSTAKLQELTDICLSHNVKVLNVPPARKWINGELSFKQIKKVNIEDLLGRDAIRLDVDVVRKQLTGKTVLVTGAAGSIGSELCRQIAKFNPALLVLLDQAESPLYELELELRNNFSLLKLESVIGDICAESRMQNLFRTFNPQVVYHAAAYKHVPLMEDNPSEAIRTNVLGTRIIADLAVSSEVERFVMVSTDKAVKPSSVMGATKRIAEMYTQSLSAHTRTAFVTTRFGNVLGSNGSVIPLFRKQIEKGGPVTITHPEITRFFMTIPEACQLVLEAGTFGQGGEIFIFDMGKSVKIVDLARKMIALSGLELGKDIQISFTGLRPGEKLYEELLNDKENTIPTHHPQIMKARVQTYDFPVISSMIDRLVTMFDTQDNMKMVAAMKEIVPEFRSNNSVYEQLDSRQSTTG